MRARHMRTLNRQHSQGLQAGLQLHLYREMVASSGRPAMISTLNLFSWNIASASSLPTTTLWKRCFSFTICRRRNQN